MLSNCAESGKSSSAFDSYFNNQRVCFSTSGPKPTDFMEKNPVLPASLNQTEAAHGCNVAQQYGLGGVTLLETFGFGERLVSEVKQTFGEKHPVK